MAAINNSRDEEIAILKKQCTIDTSLPVGADMVVPNSTPKAVNFGSRSMKEQAHDNAMTALANRISSGLEVRVVIIIDNEMCLTGNPNATPLFPGRSSTMTRVCGAICIRNQSFNLEKLGQIIFANRFK